MAISEDVFHSFIEEVIVRLILAVVVAAVLVGCATKKTETAPAADSTVVAQDTIVKADSAK